MVEIPTADDIRGLQPPALEALRERVDSNLRALHIDESGDVRVKSDGEQRDFNALLLARDNINARLEQHGHLADVLRRKPQAVQATMREAALTAAGTDPDRHPLAYTSQSLDALQRAIDLRESGRVMAADTETRAALTTSTFGAPRVWGTNVLSGPRLLHIAAGVPQQPSDAVLAQFPQLTLPTAQASVGENVSLAEYAASAAGNATLARYGRWTDLSREALVGADAGALVGMHQVGIALDLDQALINATEAAAGAAVAFNADVSGQIKKAINQVMANTAAADPTALVVLVHPDNANLLEVVTPTGGETIGEQFVRFAGALVYPSTAVDTGFMTVCNLRVGARYFEARPTQTELDVDVKTGTVTTATSVIAAYGITLTTGFAVKQDVVTP